MSYIPIASPDDLQSSSLFEGMPKTSDLRGVYESAVNLLTTSPAADLVHSINSSERVGMGQYLSPEEIKEKYPQAYNKYKSGGGHEAQVAYDDKVISEHNYRTDLVQNMNPGFLAWAARFAGSAIGMVLSPTTIATGIATGGLGAFAESVAMSSEAVASLITADKWAGRLYKAQAGAIEGGLVMQPSTIGEDIYRKYAGEKHVHMFSDMGYSFINGALAGAGLKTLFGTVPTMDKHYAQVSVETASRQFAAGEKLNVAPILKQGYYEASKGWTHTPEEIQDAIDEAKPERDKLSAKQADVESKIEDHKKSLSEPIRHDQAAEADTYKNFIKNNDLEASFKMKDLYKKSSKLSKDLDDVKAKAGDLDDTLDNTEAYKQMALNKPKPIDQSELLSDVKKIGSPENKVTFDKEDRDKSDEIMKSDAPIYQKENMNQDELGGFLDAKNKELDDVLDKANLSNEAKDLLEEADHVGKQHEGIAKALEDYKQCRSAE